MEKKRAKSPGRLAQSGAARAKSPGRSKSPGRARAAELARQPTKKQRRWKEQHEDSDVEGDDAEDVVMPAEMQRKVMMQARIQQEEVAAEAPSSASGGTVGPSLRPGRTKASAAYEMPDDDDDDGEMPDEDEEAAELARAGEYYEEVEELELGEDDERALNLLMGGSGGTARTLADVIMEKINERSAAMASGEGGGEVHDEPTEPELPPKVVEVYTSVGKLLSTYRSGKLPKAFKIVPRLANWEEILYVTDPDGWTPAATCEATKLFASNLNPKMAQRYFNLILLPAVQVRFASARTGLRAPVCADRSARTGLRAPVCTAGSMHTHGSSHAPSGDTRVRARPTRGVEAVGAVLALPPPCLWPKLPTATRAPIVPRLAYAVPPWPPCSARARRLPWRMHGEARRMHAPPLRR